MIEDMPAFQLWNLDAEPLFVISESKRVLSALASFRRQRINAIKDSFVRHLLWDMRRHVSQKFQSQGSFSIAILQEIIRRELGRLSASHIGSATELRELHRSTHSRSRIFTIELRRLSL